MNTKTRVSIIIIVLVILGAYWMLSKKDSDTNTETTNQSPITSEDIQTPGEENNNLPIEPAAVAARKDLATRLSINEKSIVILLVEETTWTDGCLGLGGIAESCLQALVPGFRVEMLAQGKNYIYRTDKTGDSVRMQPEK